jgi:hypothetical protein
MHDDSELGSRATGWARARHSGAVQAAREERLSRQMTPCSIFIHCGASQSRARPTDLPHPPRLGSRARRHLAWEAPQWMKIGLSWCFHSAEPPIPQRVSAACRISGVRVARRRRDDPLRRVARRRRRDAQTSSRVASATTRRTGGDHGFRPRPRARAALRAAVR